MVASDGADLPFPTHHRRFTVAAFTFLDSGSQRALGGPVRNAVTLAPACSPSKQHKLVSNLSSTLGANANKGSQTGSVFPSVWRDSKPRSWLWVSPG